MASETHYITLGVDQKASADQIRSAYLARSKMFHPDRFDPNKQAQEWNLANEMLKELNHAYSVLKDPASRAAYDASLQGRTAQRHQPSRPPSSPQQNRKQPSPDLGPLSSGFSRFGDLPRAIRDRLLERVSGKNLQQFSTAFDGVGWNYFFLLLSIGYFFLMFVFVQAERWTSDGKLWAFGLSVASSVFLGGNISWIVRWHKSPLKCRFIVTPLYFIKTHLDQVWFWPLWKLRDVKATHNYRNGMFTGTDVLFVFDTGSESFSFKDRHAYEQLIAATQAFDSKVRSARQHEQYEYFLAEDDFREWGSTGPSKPRRSPSSTTVISIALSIVAGLLLTLIAIGVNAVSFPYAPPSRFASVQPVSPATPIAPSRPVSTPLPLPAFNEPEVPSPKSGEVRRYTTAKAVAPLQIKSSVGDDYLVKLDDGVTGRPVLSVFVRGGQTEEIDVPLGTYVVKYASGERWYGYTHLFGPDTQYNKADKEFTFDFNGSSYSGYTLTLYKVRDGNLHTSKIRPDDF